MLNERHRLAQRAILPHRERHHAARRVIGDEHRLARRINVQIAGRGAEGRLPVQQLQLAGSACDRVRGDLLMFLSAELPGVNRIEELLVRSHSQKERILDICRPMDRLQVAGPGG